MMLCQAVGRQISFTKYWSPGSANTKYTPNIIDTAHYRLFAIAAKDAGSAVTKDAQIAAPLPRTVWIKVFRVAHAILLSPLFPNGICSIDAMHFLTLNYDF